MSIKPAMITPTSLRSGAGQSPKNTSASPTTSAAIALNMSWQLLVVLVVPIVGGHLLDVHYKTSPVWICIGMAVAVIATILVVLQTVRQLNELMDIKGKTK